MYVTALNVQQVDLPHCLDGAKHKIALVEVNYSPRWYNISKALGNHWFSTDGLTHTIPDGYYNFCALDEVFKRYGMSVGLHGPTGHIRITTGAKPVRISPGLARILGFPGLSLVANKIHHATRPHQLAIHRELFVHLKELSTSENVVNGLPSTLLRAVPVGNESCASGQTWSPGNIEYKRLSSCDLSRLTIEVLGADGDALPFEYIRMTLSIVQW